MRSAAQYLVDDKGHTTAVLVPVKEWEALHEQQRQLTQKLAVFNSIRDGLREVRDVKKSGRKLQTLKDFFGVSVVVRVAKSFKAAVKPLLKKYPSMNSDLLDLEAKLVLTPTMGTPLGGSAYKIRLKIGSKGRGKSGGARVISLVELDVIGELTGLQSEEETTVNLITIYDKADTASISNKELKELIKALRNEGT